MLKRTVFIQNINVVLQYYSRGQYIYFFFLKKLILLFSKDMLNG